MRDYVIRHVPFTPIVSVEPIAHDKIEALVERMVAALAERNGGKYEDILKGRLNDDENAPPRTIAKLIMTQAVKRVRFSDGRVLESSEEIARWIHPMPDAIALELFRECVMRAN